jgi:hypothetical protein
LTIQNRELRQITDRDHGLKIYLNLASRVTVRGPNQLWIADITYVRLKAEFRLFGSGPGRFLSQGGGVIAGSILASSSSDECIGKSDHESAAASRTCSPL